MNDIEVIQNNNDIFIGQNEYDLMCREDISDYIIQTNSKLIEALSIAFDFISLAANSYKLTNDKTSESDVYRMLQSRGSQLKEHKFLNALLQHSNAPKDTSQD